MIKISGAFFDQKLYDFQMIVLKSAFKSVDFSCKIIACKKNIIPDFGISIRTLDA